MKLFELGAKMASGMLDNREGHMVIHMSSLLKGQLIDVAINVR